MKLRGHSNLSLLFICYARFICCMASTTVNYKEINMENEEIRISENLKIAENRNTNMNKTNDNEPDSQNFFQSFVPLFGAGHSRPLLYPDHAQKPSFKTASFRELNPSDQLLGSGNFGVVKGGTYYADREETGGEFADTEPFAYVAARKKNPPPAFRNGGDFFAHFRDFADITAPGKAFSEYYVVYVNQNETSTRRAAPRNIIEQLAMLDTEESKSKFKRKLGQYKRLSDDKDKARKSKLHDMPKEVPEPLLALS